MVRVQFEQIVKQYDSLEGVTLTGYKGPPALDGIDLTIEDGETMSIVGPSGCGKSTILKVVSGLEYPNKGRILYDGYDMTQIKPQDRGVGMVFQDYALYPSMKGKGNLAYYFEQHQTSQDEQEKRVRETAELMGVGFETLLGRLPDTLSGGEKQRVAIARCIVRSPTVFLMDEPIVNLDAKLRERTRIEIKKLLKRFKITTFYVTHDQQEAVFMGDRITVMKAGKIQQVGTFDELYYSPANLFVATFIGTPPISILPVEVRDGQVLAQGVRWELPENLRNEISPGRRLLGVRPEGWVLDAQDGMNMAVRHIERIPTERAAFLHGILGGANITALAAIDHPEVKQSYITPNWEQSYFFDSTSEEVVRVPGMADEFF